MKRKREVGRSICLKEEREGKKGEGKRGKKEKGRKIAHLLLYPEMGIPPPGCTGPSFPRKGFNLLIWFTVFSQRTLFGGLEPCGIGLF